MDRVFAGSLVGLWIALGSASALAGPFDDPYNLPEGARPPTLPELTHPDLEATLELSTGFLVPRGGGRWGTVFVQRVAAELPLGERRWFVGMAFPWAFGADVRRAAGRPLSGNLELSLRTVWATSTGLAAGGGVGTFLPTGSARLGDGSENFALDVIATRPWEIAHFTPEVTGMRAFFDVRALDGPFVIQFRQSIDVLVGMHSASIERSVALMGVFLGFRLSSKVNAGIEAFEQYVLDDPGKDHTRASFVLSPTVRVRLPYLEPTLTLFSSVGTPFQDRASMTFGARLSVSFVYDVTPSK